MEDKEKQLKKLQTLQAEPNLAFFDELTSLNDKLEALQGVLSDINIKEVKTYEDELKTLHYAILSLTESVNSKDTVVNIPLDQLSAQLVKVESAIKAIGVFKEQKFPEFPSELSLSEIQINELLLAINSIPEFPIKELEKMIIAVGKKIEDNKIILPEDKEFDYNLLEKKFNEVIKAVRGISIVVSGNNGLSSNDSNTLSSIAGLNIPSYDYKSYGYTGTNITTITYKTGGSSGTTVATLTLAYDGSNNLTSVTKS